jgi:hypothetical protein
MMSTQSEQYEQVERAAQDAIEREPKPTEEFLVSSRELVDQGSVRTAAEDLSSVPKPAERPITDEAPESVVVAFFHPDQQFKRTRGLRQIIVTPGKELIDMEPVHVAVGGRVFKLERGKVVTVPECVVCALLCAEAVEYAPVQENGRKRMRRTRTLRFPFTLYR